MDLNELLKAAPQLQSIATTIVAGVPLAEMFKRIVLPSADVLGKRMADRVERCFGDATKMIDDAKATPHPLQDKLIVEILKGASLEDDENLHHMWAALLANAASLENAASVRPGFIAILRQMAADEASVLKWTHDHSQGWSQHISGLKWAEAQAELGFTSREEARRSSHIDPRLATCLDALEAQQLIRRNYWHRQGADDETYNVGRRPMEFTLALTERGRAFIEACRPPKPKS